VVSSKVVRTALYNKLNTASVTSLLGSGSASLVHAVASPTANYPLCVFHKQAGTSTNRFGGEAFKDHLWVVKGVVKATSASVAEDIDAAATALLNFSTLSLSSGSLMSMIRESDVDYPETTGDIQYRHCGGIYRLKVQD
jgi:hypothetical protein